MTTSLPLPRLNIPSTLVIGAGASRLVGQEAARLRIKRPLVVTDAYLEKVGLAQQVLDDLAAADIQGTVFARVDPDPSLANVHDGLAALRQSECDAVIAIGGGSSLDAGKTIAVMSRNAGAVADYMGYHKVPQPGLPVIAIPTTAGTGAEVTKAVVITDTERQVKMLLMDAHLLPTAALVDYELSLTMPGPLTVAVGVDSLTHAIEAYVSRKANPVTDLVALEAARLIGANLRNAYEEPSDRTAREAMMLGATLAGIAFSNASVALVHGMSRPIGAYFHVPHGLSNAMLLPAVTEFSVSAATARYATVARHAGLADAADDRVAGDQLVQSLKDLNRDLRVPTPSAYGIDPVKYREVTSQMALDALASGSPGNNPRVPTAEEIVALYERVFGS